MRPSDVTGSWTVVARSGSAQAIRTTCARGDRLEPLMGGRAVAVKRDHHG